MIQDMFVLTSIQPEQPPNNYLPTFDSTRAIPRWEWKQDTQLDLFVDPGPEGIGAKLILSDFFFWCSPDAGTTLTGDRLPPVSQVADPAASQPGAAVLAGAPAAAGADSATVVDGSQSAPLATGSAALATGAIVGIVVGLLGTALYQHQLG
jgi:hypothetical protein